MIQSNQTSKTREIASKCSRVSAKRLICLRWLPPLRFKSGFHCNLILKKARFTIYLNLNEILLGQWTCINSNWPHSTAELVLSSIIICYKNWYTFEIEIQTIILSISLKGLWHWEACVLCKCLGKIKKGVESVIKTPLVSIYINLNDN